MIDIIKDEIQNLRFDFPYSPEEWAKTLVMENYHKHTTWSNLLQPDSATSIKEFIQKSDELGGTCYFSGEHGFQGEWLKAYDICKQTENENTRKDFGITKPFKFRYSTEAYWVKDRNEKDATNCHIVIVAKNYQGIRKLNYILSEASDNGFYHKPRIDLELLFSLSKNDVFITSACVAGWKYDDAPAIWLEISKHFGDSFFLEYQSHTFPEQIEVNKKIQYLSKEYNIQTIIGLDTHYISEKDRIKRQNVLTRKKISYPEEEKCVMDYPSGAEVLERMRKQGILSDGEIIRSMLNTHVFINGCEEIDIKTHFKIPILSQFQDMTYDERTDVLSEILATELEKDVTYEDVDEKTKGLSYELSEIRDSGTSDYFLVNHEIVKKATSSQYGGLLTTTSRGSASSYYTSKLLGFTTIDRFHSEVPIIPERFVTKERIINSHQCPDIDFNIAEQKPFVQATRDILGQYSCYPLLAVGTYGEKSGFKLYADINGIEPSAANEITKNIDAYNTQVNSVDDEFKDSIKIRDYIKDKAHYELFLQSKDYQGIIEMAKVHACGHLIFNGDVEKKDVVGYGDIRYEIGLVRCSSKSGKSKDTLVVCVEGDLLDKYGYVKNDYLIVDTVSIIHKLYEAIGMGVPPVGKLREMVNGDKGTWDIYAKGITCCINQCEKSFTTENVMKYKPQTPRELSAFIAAIRPGFKSLIDGFLSRIDYTCGESSIDNLLKDSFHYMLYQEAVMLIFSFLGIPMKNSYDTIRKISKKKLVGKELKHVETTLRKHWVENIHNEDNFDEIYHVVKDSAKYSFNAPHALSMCYDSLYEAWCKAHHTAVFYEVVLNHYEEKGDKNKIALLLEEANRFYSYRFEDFKHGQDNTRYVVDDTNKIIYPTLSGVKGIGRKAAETIKLLYDRGYRNLIDAYLHIRGTNINKTVFRNLVKIRYFKDYGNVKTQLKILDMVDDFQSSGKEKHVLKKGENYFGLTDNDLMEFCTDVLESGNISSKRWTITNWIGLVKKAGNIIKEDEFPSYYFAYFQYQVLEYINYIDPNIDKRYVVVTGLDTSYSPKFEGYCIKTGKTEKFKVHKKIPYKSKGVTTSFHELPFNEGDVLYIKEVRKESVRIKQDEEWVDVPDKYDLWIKNYRKVLGEQK